MSALDPRLTAAPLTPEAIVHAAQALITDEATVEEKMDFLRGLNQRGETAEEISGFVRAFLAVAVRPPLRVEELDRPAIDVCGTGGDKLDLFNVSTTSMFVVAADGVAIVKHGNRGISSKSGGADVLEALGVPINLSPAGFAEMVKKVGLGFMLAPLYHPAFKHVAEARKRLAAEGARTMFNLIGPLLNPLEPQYQLLGVFSHQLLPLYADILHQLGRKRAWAVHGTTPDGRGMDELSTLAPSYVSEWRDDRAHTTTLTPAELGFAPAELSQVTGGDAAQNADILQGILQSRIQGPQRDLVVLNAAASLVVTGRQPDLAHGCERARELIDSGQAQRVLDQARAFTSDA
jgi:anthranilate phosphoribosyltransferase